MKTIKKINMLLLSALFITLSVPPTTMYALSALDAGQVKGNLNKSVAKKRNLDQLNPNDLRIVLAQAMALKPGVTNGFTEKQWNTLNSNISKNVGISLLGLKDTSGKRLVEAVKDLNTKLTIKSSVNAHDFMDAYKIAIDEGLLATTYRPTLLAAQVKLNATIATTTKSLADETKELKQISDALAPLNRSGFSLLLSTGEKGATFINDGHNVLKMVGGLTKSDAVAEYKGGKSLVQIVEPYIKFFVACRRAMVTAEHDERYMTSLFNHQERTYSLDSGRKTALTGTELPGSEIFVRTEAADVGKTKSVTLQSAAESALKGSVSATEIAELKTEVAAQAKEITELKAKNAELIRKLSDCTKAAASGTSTPNPAPSAPPLPSTPDPVPSAPPLPSPSPKPAKGYNKEGNIVSISTFNDYIKNMPLKTMLEYIEQLRPTGKIAGVDFKQKITLIGMTEEGVRKELSKKAQMIFDAVTNASLPRQKPRQAVGPQAGGDNTPAPSGTSNTGSSVAVASAGAIAPLPAGVLVIPPSSFTLDKVAENSKQEEALKAHVEALNKFVRALQMGPSDVIQDLTLNVPPGAGDNLARIAQRFKDPTAQINSSGGRALRSANKLPELATALSSGNGASIVAGLQIPMILAKSKKPQARFRDGVLTILDGDVVKLEISEKQVTTLLELAPPGYGGNVSEAAQQLITTGQAFAKNVTITKLVLSRVETLPQLALVSPPFFEGIINFAASMATSNAMQAVNTGNIIVIQEPNEARMKQLLENLGIPVTDSGQLDKIADQLLTLTHKAIVSPEELAQLAQAFNAKATPAVTGLGAGPLVPLLGSQALAETTVTSNIIGARLKLFAMGLQSLQQGHTNFMSHGESIYAFKGDAQTLVVNGNPPADALKISTQEVKAAEAGADATLATAADSINKNPTLKESLKKAGVGVVKESLSAAMGELLGTLVSSVVQGGFGK